eukprot:1128558_1
MSTLSSYVCIGLLIGNAMAGCCSNTDCYVTYQSTEDLCFMKAEYPTQLHEGFCWDGDCVPVVGHQGSCQSKKSYDEGCRNAAGHADNNNCVTNLCSSSTNKCEAKSTSGTCLPSHQPTKKPTLKPTPRTTPKPTPKPTQNPTKNPTNPPTALPTTDPTVYPSVQPTTTPTIDPTVHSSTMFHIQPTSEAENGSSWFGLDAFDLTLLAFGSILFVGCIIVIVFVSKANKHRRGEPEWRSTLLNRSLTISETDDDKEAIPIQNAMVILIAIGEYDVNPDDPDPELAALGGLNNLKGIDKDIQHLHRLFGPNRLNYTIYPKYMNVTGSLKVHWTQTEIVQLLNEKATYLDSHLDEFDGLIVVISGHGMKGFICTSDCKMIEKLAIHRLFSLLHLRLRHIPRVFLFDCCDGEWECKDRNKGPSDQRKLYTCKDIGSTDIAWGKDEKNPDHRLAQIDAANPGFQSKFNRKKGSYMLFEFVERTISRLDHEQNTCIYRIFDEVQQHLAEKGKQLIKTSYSDRTRWITLLPKQRDTEDEKNDMMDSDDSVLDEILDETIVEMATKDCINNPAFDVQENH